MEQSAIDVAGHGTLRSYLIGFVLAIILTIIPFWVVMHHSLSEGAILTTIFVAALVQVVVHLHYFLHLDTSVAQRGNVAAIVFTAIAAVVVVAGSIWIMYMLHFYMHPHPAGAISSIAHYVGC